jgi:hypothetical protein
MPPEAKKNARHLVPLDHPRGAKEYIIILVRAKFSSTTPDVNDGQRVTDFGYWVPVD